MYINKDRWEPEHWGEKIKRGKYRFKQMGSNIVYLPVFYYNDGIIKPMNDAFIIGSIGNTHFLNADTSVTRQITTLRKYLTRPDLEFWRKCTTGSYFEKADGRNFKTAKIITEMEKKVEMFPTIKYFDKPVYTRFLRYTFSDNYDCLAELYIYSQDENGELARIEKKISLNIESDFNQIKKLFDNNILTFVSFPVIDKNEKLLQISFDFGKPTKIVALGICPRNHKNNVIKGIDYELFCWDRRWISLGVKTANNYTLMFNNVPPKRFMAIEMHNGRK